MWIEELKNGKYKAVERYTDPVTGKAKKVSVTIEKDTRTARKEAQRLLDVKIEEAMGKTDYDNMTLKELSDRYVETVTKPSTHRTVKYSTARMMKVIGDNVCVSRLTAFYVSGCMKDCTNSEYNAVLRTFKTVIRFGYDRDFVKDKAWLDKLKPRKEDKKTKVENKYLEADELALLIESMNGMEHWQLLTKFLALSGLRIGEALALTMDDIDTYIHVTKTFMTKIGIVGDTPKTIESNRDVFIQPELACVISSVKKWRLEWMLRKKIRSDKLFPLKHSSYIGYLSLKSDIVPEKKISPHTFRHTHASLLAESGMSLEAISRRLGHADSDITKEIYLHVTNKMKEREEEQLSKIKIL